jgi:hypothetical protein
MSKICRQILLLQFLILLGCRFTYSQSKNIYLFIDSTAIIGKISENKLYTSETNIAYTLQGNSIYLGDSISKAGLLFLVNAKDILSKKAGLVYQNDAKTIQYITRNATFYLGDHPIDEQRENLLWLEPENDSLILVKNGQSGKVIGMIDGKGLTQVQIVAAAHMYIKHYGLDDAVNAMMNSLIAIDMTEGDAYLRPANEYLPYFEWVWDGKILKPAWGYRPEDEWSFDGKYLKPVWSADPHDEWQWDGSMLKPVWESGVENQYVWDDGQLKPFWDSNPDLMWVIDDYMVRPMWSFDPTKQWSMEGNIPLPIIAIIVLGFADR